MEYTEGVSGEGARYGIANLQPNRAIKKCKIRNLTVEYFLSEIAVFLITPKPCSFCERRDECTDDFVEQIIEKYNDRHPESDAYFLL